MLQKVPMRLNVDVAVGHSDLGQALLADFLTSSSELADFTNVGSLGCLSTGVGVHLSIEDHNVDILAGVSMDLSLFPSFFAIVVYVSPFR